jgi:hypothetical protein
MNVECMNFAGGVCMIIVLKYLKKINMITTSKWDLRWSK